MCEIAQFPRHTLAGSTLAPCDCSGDGGCMLCDGGLALCVRCGGAEATMPRDCPGRPMNREQKEFVQAGLLEYTWRKGWHWR